MFATEDKYGHAKVCLTLIFKVMQLKTWVSRSTVEVTSFIVTCLISSILKIWKSTPRSSFNHVCNRRLERSCKRMFDLDFQGHAIKIEFFYYHCWIPWPQGTCLHILCIIIWHSNPNMTRIIIIVIAWGPLDPRCAECALEAFLCDFLCRTPTNIFPVKHTNM